MDKLFFDSWDSILRTLIIGVSSYLVLLVMLKIFGNRTLSQLNAFDLIVTVALGSTLATVILNKNVALADGLLALLLLIVLQYIVSKLSKNSRAVESAVKSEPRLLAFKGNLLDDAMKNARISEEEIYQVVRSNGYPSIKNVDAVIIETNGALSVIKSLDKGDDALKYVKGTENVR